MHDGHEGTDAVGKFCYVLSLVLGFVSEHWAALLSVLFGLVGVGCSIINTRLRVLEYRDKQRDPVRAARPFYPSNGEALH